MARTSTAALQAQIDALQGIVDAQERTIEELRTRITQLELSPRTSYTLRRTQSEQDRTTIREAAMRLAQQLGRSVTRQEVLASMGR